MKTPRWYILGWIVGLLLLMGCGQTAVRKAAVPGTKAENREEKTQHLNHAQPKLITYKLYLADKTVLAEIARSVQEIATGMMFRESMVENEGMLFVFDYPHQTAFYMKNTKIPLTCAYMDTNGKILEIYDMEPLNLAGIPAKSDKIQYVLEMNQGWFKDNAIGVGTRVVTEKGTLNQTFFGR